MLHCSVLNWNVKSPQLVSSSHAARQAAKLAAVKLCRWVPLVLYWPHLTVVGSLLSGAGKVWPQALKATLGVAVTVLVVVVVLVLMVALVVVVNCVVWTVVDCVMVVVVGLVKVMVEEIVLVDVVVVVDVATTCFES